MLILDQNRSLFLCSQWGPSSTDGPLWASPLQGWNRLLISSHSWLEGLLVKLCGVFTFQQWQQAEEEEKTWPFFFLT